MYAFPEIRASATLRVAIDQVSRYNNLFFTAYTQAIPLFCAPLIIFCLPNNG
jgi:hypothetical protein